MKQDDKKTEQPELTPEVIEAFMEARRQMVASMNERLNKTRKDNE